MKFQPSLLAKNATSMGPKGFRGRSESPLVAPAGVKFPVFARKQGTTCKQMKQKTSANDLGRDAQASCPQPAEKALSFIGTLRK